MLTILVLIWVLLFLTVLFNIKVGNIFILGDYVEFKDKFVAVSFLLFLLLSMLIGLIIILKGVYGQW
ncbi:putative membrane protein [Staphylococcus phage Twort]|uniref:Membrane protein n=1 Tax=Staphylococcus phage Twort (strain DSM 17442 / HER 48) TaxID=2908167 RepID=A0A6H0X5L2_BPTWO|nr:putative membrane protein [Staphylococcus phage Twort]